MGNKRRRYVEDLNISMNGSSHTAATGPYTYYAGSVLSAVENAANEYTISGHVRHIGPKVTAMTVKLLGAMTDDNSNNGLLTTPAVVKGSTAERIGNTNAFQCLINGYTYHIAANTVGTTLPSYSASIAGTTITQTKYGIIMVYVDNAGTLQYRFPNGPGGTQAYANALAAYEAGIALVTPPNMCLVGWVQLYSNVKTWESGTDDLTDGSDITTALFISAPLAYNDLAVVSVNSTELTNGRFYFIVTDATFSNIRAFVSSMSSSTACKLDLKITASAKGGI